MAEAPVSLTGRRRRSPRRLGKLLTQETASGVDVANVRDVLASVFRPA